MVPCNGYSILRKGVFDIDGSLFFGSFVLSFVVFFPYLDVDILECYCIYMRYCR